MSWHPANVEPENTAQPAERLPFIIGDVANHGSEPGVSSLGPIQRHKTVGVGILGVCLVMLAARLDPFR
jgi:hypothetical protein